MFSNPRTGVMVVAYWNHPSNTTSSVSDQATILLSPWVASGTWTVTQVVVADRQNNARVYTPAGVQSGPADGTTASNSIDWSLSFSVSNALEDITRPQLTSLRMLSQTITAGTAAVLMYTGTDDLSGIAQVAAEYTSPRGNQFEIANNDPVTAGVGPATWLVPLSAYGGTYTLTTLEVDDRAGNRRLYGVQDPNPDANGDNDLDLSAASFTVTPVTEDATAPTLDSITRQSADTVGPGDVLAFNYAAHDDATSIKHVEMWVVDPEGHQYTLYRDCPLGRGEQQTLAMRLPDYAVQGTWTVLQVELLDGQGNISWYHADGSVTHEPTSAAGPTQHNLNFASLSFQVGSQQTASPGPINELPACTYTPTVSFSPVTSQVPVGQPVDINGQVSRNGNAVPDPQVAVYAADASGVQLVDVLQGDQTGAFHERVVPAHAMTYWANFFGQIGANPASSLASTPQTVHVEYPTAATIATSTGHLVAGQSVTISAHIIDLSSPISRVPVLSAQLWKRVGTSAWTLATTVSSNSTSVSVVQRPRWTTRYEWRYAGKQLADSHDVLNAAISPVKTVTVAPAISAARTATTLPFGHNVRVYGTVTPSTIGQYVYLQRLYATGWKTVAYARITRQRMPNNVYETGYLINYKPNARGSQSLRCYRPATSVNTAGTSRTFGLSVQ